jgi:hypothetical protein
MTIKTRLEKLEASLPQPSPIPAEFMTELSPEEAKLALAVMAADDETPQAEELYDRFVEMMITKTTEFLEWLAAKWGQPA